MTPAPAHAPAPVIEVEGVTKVHGKGDVQIAALRGVDLTVREGEYVAIMGPSGSGKTTLLGILGCLDRPTAGSYRLAGEEVSSLSESRRAKIRGDQIGFIFQAFNLIPKSTALNNVELPMIYAGIGKHERRERAMDALDAVGLADRAHHRPSQLSGGEQQRVAIARAIVVEPYVLLADEPTGNLDSGSAEEVLRILDYVNGMGATIVMVTHAPEVGKRAARIVRFADGLIVGDAPVRKPPHRRIKDITAGAEVAAGTVG